MPYPVHHQTRFRLFLIFALVVSMGLSGIAWTKSEERSGHTCQVISVVAAIGADTVAHNVQANKVILPRIDFPGLSHAELVKLSAENTAREQRNQRKLEAVAKATC